MIQNTLHGDSRSDKNNLAESEFLCKNRWHNLGTVNSEQNKIGWKLKLWAKHSAEKNVSLIIPKH